MTASQPCRLLLLGDSVLSPLAAQLRSDALTPVLGPYDQVQQVLRDPDHPAWEEPPDVVLTWTQPQQVLPAFRQALETQQLDWEALAAEVDVVADVLTAAAARGGTYLVVSWALPPHERGIQTLSLQPGGIGHTLLRLNLLLAERLAPVPNLVLLDAQYWHSACDAAVHSPKWQALGKIAFSAELFAIAAREVRATLAALQGRARKLIVCDLDNTLWGGIAGDDGLTGLALGGHDPRGEAFRQVQLYLKRLQRRGILLAIASKNEASTAMGIIDKHPEMVLRRDDFVAWRINWQDKAANLAELAAELNLGLASIVFLDDNPVERDRVRSALPEVLVPELPDHWAAYPSFVASLACFETPGLSREDAGRTALYRAERQRRQAKADLPDLDTWLHSLQIRFDFQPLTAANLPRVVQLLNKSNQFNMATRRLDEDAFRRWSEQPHHLAWTGRVYDKFGDQGLCLVLTARLSGDSARLVDLVMSCRVMGRGIEQAAMTLAAEALRAHGVERLYAALLPTPANKPIQRFLRPLLADAKTQQLRLSALRLPDHIQTAEALTS